MRMIRKLSIMKNFKTKLKLLVLKGNLILNKDVIMNINNGSNIDDYLLRVWISNPNLSI